MGIFNGPSENVVGGTTLASRNLLSGNGDSGVFISNSNGNRTQGNYVGTDRSGTKALGNEDSGVFMNGAIDNTVGGTTAASRNLISGNDSDGVTISGGDSNEVIGNRIGTTTTGTGTLQR